MLMLFKFLKISCSLLNIRGADYCYIINENSKHDAVNLQKKCWFNCKRSFTTIKKIIKNLSPYIKWVKEL